MNVKQDNTASDRALTTKEAAELLGISPRSLENFRLRGGGPEYIRISARVVRYRLSALHAWMDDRTAVSTTQEAAK